jgi:hypothetical protein
MEKQLSPEHFYKLRCALLQRMLAEVALKQSLDELAKVQHELGLSGFLVLSTDERTKKVTLKKLE